MRAEEASLVKNASNVFLAMRLTFANEVAGLAEDLGVDVGPVLEGIGHDPRIGHTYMRPSYGFGGSCLPKEVRSLSSAGLDRGLPMHLTGAIAEANSDHQRRFARRIATALGGLAGKRIGLLGLAFKVTRMTSAHHQPFDSRLASWPRAQTFVPTIRRLAKAPDGSSRT
jgi:UDPglucose 6-dehydrogenase